MGGFFDPDRFVDDLGQALASEAPDELKSEIFSNEALAVQVLGLQKDAKEGLRLAFGSKSVSAVEVLRGTLQARKRAALVASDHAYTLERLLSRAIEQIVAKAAEVAG